MKVILHPNNEQLVIKKALKHNRRAQKQLFDCYSSKMLGVCRQFIKDLHFAEDTMIKGFTKAFKNLNQFELSKSFEAWLKSIMINESISFLRSKQSSFVTSDSSIKIISVKQRDFDLANNIQQAIDILPLGYKTVFILHAIEGYKHSEIALQLNISIDTSKSQLSKARHLLKKLLKDFNTQYYE